MQEVKRNLPSEEVRLQGEQQLPGQPLAFFDPTAAALWQAKIQAPVQIDLEVGCYQVTQAPGGLTTANLRFPHLLKDLSLKFSNEQKGEGMSIGIVGPGLSEAKDTLSSCPQFVEIYGLFPKAHYLLLDRDKRALSVLIGQLHDCQFTAYDPLMLKTYLFSEKYQISSVYQKTFRDINSTLGELAIEPKNAKEMLQGHGQIDSLTVKVDPKNVDLREFEINASQFEEQDKAQFDVLVATLSISAAVDSQSSRTLLTKLETLGKFLELLKPNGALYIDALFTTKFLLGPYGEEGMKLGLKYLESCLGNRLKNDEIPLSDFQTQMTNIIGTLNSLDLSSVKTGKTGTASTAALTVITRLPEKVISTPEEREALKQQVLALPQSGT